MSALKWQLIWHFADGTSFFIGTAILLLAALIFPFLKPKWRTLVYPLILIAAVEIFFSANPLAVWFYLIWGTAIIFWLITYRASICVIAVLLCCAAIAIELPYHLMPNIPQGNNKTLYVIGDSVSAGIGGVKERPWPQILGKEHNITVINLARAGATVGSAIRQAKQLQDQNAVVFVEIGGNDLFAPTPTKEFRASLDKILSSITSPTRTVIMLELPLLPLQNEYGRIQRTLAKKYNVILIPKQFFVGILSTKDATVDLAHLSQKGHELMAKKVWALINSAMGL